MPPCVKVPSILMALLLACPAMAQEAATDLDTLEKERKRLDREVRYKLRKQLSNIQKELARSADLADLRAAAEAARKALDEREKTDPAIVEAERAYKAASDAYNKAKADAITADPSVAAMKREIEAQYKRSEGAEKQKDEAVGRLDEIEKKLSKSPELAEAAENVEKAEDAVDKLPRTEPDLAAAAKAVEKAEKAYDDARHALCEYQARKDAEQAYEKARHALPEYQTRKEDPEAYEKARHALPEYKARNAAREAYDKARNALPEYKALQAAEEALEKLMKASPAVQAAKEALAEARKNRERKLADMLAADPDAAALLDKIKQADETIADARKKRAEIRERMRDVERAAYRKDPQVMKLRTAREAAYEVRRKVIKEQTAAEDKALDEAEDAFEKAMKAKLAADPKAAALLQEIEATEAKIDELYKQIRALRKARPPSE